MNKYINIIGFILMFVSLFSCSKPTLNIKGEITNEQEGNLVFWVFEGDEFVKKVRAPQYRQAFMERSPGTFDAAEYNRTMEINFNWLRSEAASLGSIITVNVNEEDLAELKSYECETCALSQKLRVGLVKHVGSQFSFRSYGHDR